MLYINHSRLKHDFKRLFSCALTLTHTYCVNSLFSIIFFIKNYHEKMQKIKINRKTSMI